MAERRPSERPWFAAQVRRNAFVQAERSLACYGIEVFAPKLERRIVRYGRARALKSLLFPGYLFLDGSDQQRLWSAVRLTSGLVRLVLSRSEELAVVPAEFMAELRARCDLSGRVVVGEKLSAGDMVSVVSGPFSGIVTRIEHVDEQQRVWILLDLLGADRRLAMRGEHLLKLAG